MRIWRVTPSLVRPEVLNRAIADAGLDRSSIFITNAVKHFKFEIRGKRRLHKRPDSYEIERCKWWSDIERRLVKPELIVALGATAARSLIGKTITIQKLRGNLLTLDDGGKLMVTAHPSSLLRIPDRDERHRQYHAFVNDLRRSARYLARHINLCRNCSGQTEFLFDYYRSNSWEILCL